METKWKMVFENENNIISRLEGSQVTNETEKVVMLINDCQKELLDSIANIEHSGNAEKFYVVNKLRFKVYPHIKID